MTTGKLPDDPELLDVPHEFVEEVTAEDFDEDDLPEAILRLTRFARTFFLRFLAEEFDVEITALGADERDTVSDLLVDLQKDGKQEEAWPLLAIFEDFCDFFVEVDGLSTREDAGMHESEVLSLTQRLLERLAGWADETSRAQICERATNLASELERIAKSTNK